MSDLKYVLLKKLKKPIFNNNVNFNKYINIFELKRQKIYQKDKNHLLYSDGVHPT